MTTPVGRSPAGHSGSSSGSSGSGRRDHTLGDFLPAPLQQHPSDAWQTAGRPGRRHDDHRRATLFQPPAGTPGTPAARPAARARASPDVYPADADLMARLLVVEEQNRRQAVALQQQEEYSRRQDAELHLLRTGGRSPSPAADAADRDRRIADLERLVQQLQLPSPPVLVPPAAPPAKNKSEKSGRELRENPDFLRMSLESGASALAVSQVVIKMLSLFGASGSILQQVLLWVLQLPSSATSLVPAVDTEAVHKFCADHLRITLGAGHAGVSDGAGTDCFGLGADSARRRGVFVALLELLKQDGPWRDLDNELLMSFKGRLQPSLRLSDSVLALPTFAALLAQVLHRLEHGPSSVLVSVVDTLFSYEPYSDRGTPNQVLHFLRDDLGSRMALKEQLEHTPFLLPVAMATSFLPQAPGAAGVLVAGVASQLMGLAADTATTASQLLEVVDRALQTSSHTGTLPVSWVPADASPYSRLLTARSPAAGSHASSASPAAASVSPAAPAPSKSAPSKRPPRAGAKAPPQGGQPALCPLGAACPTAGNLYNFCPLPHSKDDWAAIRERRQQQNVPCFGTASRKALLQQIAAGGGPSGGGGGGGGQPRASPSAVSAAAPTLQPVPQPVLQPAPSPAVSPSPPVPSAALAAASAERMAALTQFLGSMGTPGFAALDVPGVEVPPSMAHVPAPLVPIALAAAAPAPAAGPTDAPVWGGPGKCAVIIDSGSKNAYGPNTAHAPTRRVLAERCVTSTGAVSITDRAFSAAVHLKDAQGQFYTVVVGNVREQPGLVIPSGGGESAVPVLLVDVGTIAGTGGVFHVEGQWASDGPSEEATVSGYVRLRVHAGCDPRVEPHGRLSPKIPCVFNRGVLELPTFPLPSGAEPVPVFLGRPSASLSASSVALAAPEQAFGNLLRVCRVWHSGAVSLVPVFAASSPAEQAAYVASNGGLDPAAQLHLGLSLFSACLDDLASAVLRDIGVSVPSCSAVSVGVPVAAGAAVSSALPSRTELAAGSPGVLPAQSALVVLLDLVRRSSAVVPSSGAVPLAAPPASSSSSSSLPSPQ